jgi:hypothetical protein
MFDEPNDDEALRELEGIRIHRMRFKWLADGCETWDQVIAALKERICLVKQLRRQRAKILEPCRDDYLPYQIPSERGVYATYQGIQNDCYEFRLSDNCVKHFPVNPQADNLSSCPTGTRVILLLDAKGGVEWFYKSMIHPT